jgi:oligopeptide transport system permease protein
MSLAVETIAVAGPLPAAPGARAWASFKKNRAATTGLVVLALVVCAVAAAPWLAPQAPDAQELALGPTAPGAAHPFGTDYEGRDLWARTLHGGRISLLVGLVATLVSLVIGVTVGAVAGWHGGKVDNLLMRCVDVLYGLPYMFFVIVLMVWVGRSLVNVFIGLGAVSWLTMARIVRGQVMALRRSEMVSAAECIGVRPAAILVRHILPNALGPIVVYATLTVPRVMIEEAFLSFVGLGVQPPHATWGSLIADGAALYREYPWLLAFPATLFVVTLLALSFVGDGLRDALDPRSSATP